MNNIVVILLTCIVYNSINMAVNCNGLSGNLLEFVQAGCNVERQYIGTQRGEVLDLVERLGSGGGNDLVTTFQSSNGHLATNSRPEITRVSIAFKLMVAQSTYEQPVMTHTKG